MKCYKSPLGRCILVYLKDYIRKSLIRPLVAVVAIGMLLVSFVDLWYLDYSYRQGVRNKVKSFINLERQSFQTFDYIRVNRSLRSIFSDEEYRYLEVYDVHRLKIGSLKRDGYSYEKTFSPCDSDKDSCFNYRFHEHSLHLNFVVFMRVDQALIEVRGVVSPVAKMTPLLVRSATIFLVVFLGILFSISFLETGMLRRIGIVSDLSRKINRLKDLNDIADLIQGKTTGITEIDSFLEKISVLSVDIKKLSGRILASKKKVAIAQATQMLAHDFKGPLTVFQKVAYGSERDFSEEKENLVKALNRILSMADSIKRADLDSQVRPSSHDLLLDGILSSVQSYAEGHSVEFVANTPDLVDIHIDLVKVERAISNLLFNAIEAAESKVVLSWSLKNQALVIKVRDDGPGVPAPIESSLFTEGTTFGKESGTGLGLAFVNHVARGHGGAVEYYREGNLSVFQMTLEDVRIKPARKLDRIRAKNDSAVGGNCESISHILLSLEDLSTQEKVVESLSQRFGITISTSIDAMPYCQIIYTDDPAFLLSECPEGVRIIINSAEKAESILTRVLQGEDREKEVHTNS
ncbi:sensor histidine kinase [Pseudobacteriovorax antillogorgiicola]|uniref:sensor histidine kinase n=1 Tax=Pseudobacteriovorax antillogorgiicola TaxID=1513793 RepID=UPI00104A11D5|nr:HAMP domain-containing sensor histidine kinase [Pseudobacteriovorax antillogorgiicola]